MASPLLPIDDLSRFFSYPHSGGREAKSAALLQHFSKQSVAAITPASRLEVRPAPEMASSGIREIDALTGGLPRGCLTEICGPESSGHTTVMLAALAAATRRQETCTLIDASDSFDPLSAAAAGVDLKRLLWVRCGSPSHTMSRKRRPATSLEEWQRRRMEDPVEQALRAADLLLQSGGFGMVALDLAGVPVKMARRIPLTTWFRFRRAVENKPTILLVIGIQSCAESCASLSLQLGNRRQSPVVSRQQEVLSSQFSVPDSQFPVLSSQFSACSAISQQLSALSQMGRARLQSCRSEPQRTRALAPEVNFLTQYEVASSEQSFDSEHYCASPTMKLSHAELLTGIAIQAEVLRSRNERKTVQSVSAFPAKTAWTA